MSDKRHAKPTLDQLTQRIYRKSLAHYKDITTQLVIVRLDLAEIKSALAMLSQRMESLRTVAEHCKRLVREKEILQGRLDVANKFMSSRLKVPTLDHDMRRAFPDEDVRCGKCGRYHYGECM